MEVSASSATFTPVTVGYTLLLRGVPSTVGVFERTRAEVSASLPSRAFLAYWNAYGDETGQFTANPPRAVLRAADASGGDEEVVVRLRNGSQKGTTLRFDAEVLTTPAVWDQLEAKVDRVDDTTPPGEPVRELRAFVGGKGFAYDRVGEVDLGDHYFEAGNLIIARSDPSRFDGGRCIRYFSQGWYGVGPGAVTFYTTSRCTWFTAKWSTDGGCW